MEHFVSQNLKINFFNNHVVSDLALIFVHGNSHSLKTFKEQFADKRFSKFQLVAFDLPGHGDSDSCDSYSLELFVNVLKDLLTHLQIKKFVLVGHSLGGHIALHSLSKLMPEGVFVFGTPPLTVPMSMNGFRSHPDLGLLFKNHLSHEESLRLLKAMYNQRGVTAEDLAEFLKTDFHFREKFAQSIEEGRYLDECALLSQYRGKKLLVASDGDQLINGEYIGARFPEETIQVSLPHNMHVEDSKFFNGLVLNFCENLNNT